MKARTKSPANRNRCPASLKTLIAAESPDLPGMSERMSRHVIQIMFDTESGVLKTRLYVRKITNDCDGHRTVTEITNPMAHVFVGFSSQLRLQGFCEDKRDQTDGTR